MRMKFAFIAMSALTVTIYGDATVNATSADAVNTPIIIAQAMATDTARPNVAQQPATATPNKKKAPAKKKKNVTGVKAGGSSAVALTSFDCKAVGGTVITLTVNDIAPDRCGPSRMYCRMPDTNAVCIASQ